VKWPKDTTSFALLGNSMARCIPQRLVHRVLCAWGIFKGPDPWESALAQARRKADASGQPLLPPSQPPLAPHAEQAWEKLQRALADPLTGRFRRARGALAPRAGLWPGGRPAEARCGWLAHRGRWLWRRWLARPANGR